MPDAKRYSLLYKVASLYHEKGLKKYEIATRIKQSPTQVGLLLKEARKEGILTVAVNLPRYSVLKEKLKHRFGLKDVVVVPSDTEVSAVLSNLARATSQYFDEKVLKGAQVAIGGGYVTYKLVEELDSKQRDIDIFPTALIGRGPTISHIDPTTLVTLLWAKSGRQRGRAHYITVTPPPPDSNESSIRDYYRSLSSTEPFLELVANMERVDFVFTSIGSLSLDRNYAATAGRNTQNLLDELNLGRNYLSEQGAVGDIAYSFFDSGGTTREEWNIFPGLSVPKFFEMARSQTTEIVVTVGSYKIEALRAALNGRLCNVLITDEEAAVELLNEKEEVEELDVA